MIFTSLSIICVEPQVLCKKIRKMVYIICVICMYVTSDLSYKYNIQGVPNLNVETLGSDVGRSGPTN